MLKAFAIKGVTLLTGLAATWAVPDRLPSGCWTRGLRCVALGDAAAVRG
jgi:hypothetical protein